MQTARAGSAIVFIALATLLAGAASPLHAQQGPVQGYQYLADPHGGGGLLISRRAGSGSATALLRQAFAEVASFFDGRRPSSVGGFRDAGDQRAEVAFRATLRGSPVAGVAYAIVGGGTGTAGVAFDTPRMLGQSLPRLMQLAGGGAGAPPEAALNWRETAFPDGSGWLNLPDGWQVTFAHKGMITAKGPHGVFDRGIHLQVYTRAAAYSATQVWSYLGVPMPFSPIVAEPTDPVSALKEITPQMGAVSQQIGLPPERILRVIEAAPAPPPAGFSQAAFIDYELEVGGLRCRRLAHVLLGNLFSDGTWLYYFSQATSRAEAFAQNLPVLVQIWGSSRTADWVVQETIDKALDSLREIGEIHRQTAQNRERSQQRIHDKWTEVIRGTRIIEDTDTGRRTDVNLGWSTEIVTTLNRYEGYNRYREIPLWELNQ
jgi:hypothetical protein